MLFPGCLIRVKASNKTMGEVTKKRSALGITSLAIALFAGLCLAAIKILGEFDHDDVEQVIGAILALLMTPIGILIGLIALYKRRRQIGLIGTVALLLNVLLLAVSVYMILASFLREFAKALGNAR
jgi:hypothetical protein